MEKEKDLAHCRKKKKKKCLKRKDFWKRQKVFIDPKKRKRKGLKRNVFLRRGKVLVKPEN